MRTKRLYEGNMEVVHTTLAELGNRNIRQFETKSLFYKFIEEIKFPMTISWRENNGGWYGNNFDRAPFYSSRNYQGIESWLVDRGIISIEKTIKGTKQLVYNYNVNFKALAELKDFSPKYTSNGN